MTLNLADYIAKYPVFVGLTQQEYDSAIADAEIELKLNSWGDLYMRAQEMLIGHLLFIRDSQRWSKAGAYNSLRVDTSGYSVSKSGDVLGFQGNNFGKEYMRLLKLLQGDSTVTSNVSSGVSFIVQRSPNIDVVW